jgi:penicillin-binding protein 2
MFHAGPHHQIPWQAPHPTGFLSFDEALQRSCNVFFETLGDRLGIERLSEGMSKMGLGRITGIGIPEATGRLPRDMRGPSWRRRAASWFSAIGQDQVAATPIQMANVAATVARNGIWVRPHLLVDSSMRPTSPDAPPDVVDLHLPPEALRLARLGMTKVVNSLAGTGTVLHRDDVVIAGKTGSAQAAKYSIPMRDENGRAILDEKGRPRRQFLTPSSPEHPNPLAPWYLGTGKEGQDLTHAWFIGFAPADHPQIAFCVLVEYGGSGGIAAGPIARDIIEACVQHGYLKLDKKK